MACTRSGVRGLPFDCSPPPTGVILREVEGSRSPTTTFAMATTLGVVLSEVEGSRSPTTRPRTRAATLRGRRRDLAVGHAEISRFRPRNHP